MFPRRAGYDENRGRFERRKSANGRAEQVYSLARILRASRSERQAEHAHQQRAADGGLESSFGNHLYISMVVIPYHLAFVDADSSGAYLPAESDILLERSLWKGELAKRDRGSVHHYAHPIIA